MLPQRLRAHGPLVIALATLAATLGTLTPQGQGPGVTCDELYHLVQGKQLVTALRQQGLSFFLPENIERNFPWQLGGPPVQAPLGYWLLGGAHWLFDPAPDDPNSVSITSARFAPAIALAVLVLLVGYWTARRAGALAGNLAAVSVVLMPRLFAHGHLAALDMLTTVFFVAAVLAATEAARGGRIWHFALAGVVWGAAMLVRLHGLFVAPAVVLWLLWRFYENDVPWRRQLAALAAWGTAGVVTLFLGWPWLWLSPFSRFQQWLGSGTARQSLHVFYAHQVWADRDVPGHYPWVIFLVTVPVGLLLLGVLGLWAKRGWQRRPNELQDGEHALLIGTFVFMLGLFSWPGVPVYDGERLFLMVFPLWAVWAGVGADGVAQWLQHRLSGRKTTAADQASKPPGLSPQWAKGVAAAVVVTFVALQGVGTVLYHPNQLSYYNAMVGGLAGAEKFGFEVTYWGDTVREPLLAEAAELSPGRPVLLIPNLAPFQAPAITISSPSLQAAEAILVGPDDPHAKKCRCAIVYRRRADLGAAEEQFCNAWVVAEYRLRGVWVARLIDLERWNAGVDRNFSGK